MVLIIIRLDERKIFLFPCTVHKSCMFLFAPLMQLFLPFPGSLSHWGQEGILQVGIFFSFFYEGFCFVCLSKKQKNKANNQVFHLLTKNEGVWAPSWCPSSEEVPLPSPVMCLGTAGGTGHGWSPREPIQLVWIPYVPGLCFILEDGRKVSLFELRALSYRGGGLGRDWWRAILISAGLAYGYDVINKSNQNMALASQMQTGFCLSHQGSFSSFCQFQSQVSVETAEPKGKLVGSIILDRPLKSVEFKMGIKSLTACVKCFENYCWKAPDKR